MTVMLMISQEKWLPTQDLHKTEPSTFQHGWERDQ